MPTRSLPAVFLICLLWPVPHASAHYLWVEIDAEADEHGMAVIYFEEAPAPGDGHYLDHFTSSGKIWFRSVEQIEPKRLKPMDIRNGGEAVARGVSARWSPAQHQHVRQVWRVPVQPDRCTVALLCPAIGCTDA